MFMLDKLINNIIHNIKKEPQINQDINCVNKYINILISELYFNDKIQYLINNKGKHIRTLLSLYYFHKYTTNNNHNIDALYQIMALVELTHFASLLHDDVIDNSNSRRHEKSLNYLYGNKNSILIGDYLLVNNFKKLLNVLQDKNYGNYILNQFIKASSDTAYGAYLENNTKQQLNNDIQQYIRIVSLKTGSLFKFSCICGCVLSNTNFVNIKQSAMFGLVFGIIYQVQNDLNDYKYSNYQESEDYMQSNITLPIIVLNYIADISNLFNNKTQENFNKIKQLINTEEFKSILNNILEKYCIAAHKESIHNMPS